MYRHGRGVAAVDRRWTRADCLRYLEQQGMTAPRSACIGCPYHSDREWRELKLNAPDEFADAVTFERRCSSRRGGTVSRSCTEQKCRLTRSTSATRRTAAQLSLTDECDGMCGV